MRHAPLRRGFLEIDILAGLIIVAALTLALAAVLGRQHRAVQKLADTRAAAQVAEAVLTDLQAGHQPPSFAADPDLTIVVRPAGERPTNGSSTSSAPGAWVEVAVKVRGGGASLVGLVPPHAAVGAAGGAR